jgi:hypothetical protein
MMVVSMNAGRLLVSPEQGVEATKHLLIVSRHGEIDSAIFVERSGEECKHPGVDIDEEAQCD